MLGVIMPYWCIVLENIVQMMHGSEWTLKYDEPEIENVALGLCPCAAFSTSG